MIRQVISSAVIAATLLAAGPLAVAADPAFLTVNSVTLRYQVTGTGADTILLLQESAKPLEIWDDIVAALAVKGRKVVTYDPRGIGLSQKIRRAPTMEEEVEDVRALLDALGVKEPIVMIGGALGSSIALQFAAKYPERVAGLIVTSPSALLVPKEPRKRIDPAVDPAGARAAEEKAYKVTYPEALRTDPARFEKFRGMEASNDPDSEMLTERLINTTPFADVLPRIKCPTLVIATSMFVRPVASVKELADKIPNSEFMVMETGHAPSFQTPDMMIPVYETFLKARGF